MKTLILLSVLIVFLLWVSPNPAEAYRKGRCGRPIKQPHSRVIGGDDANRGAWPWQVALYAWDKYYLCGGSLIDREWVVTAAHCIFPNVEYSIVLGDHIRNVTEGSEQRINASKFILHPNYNLTIIDSDIALIKLERPARLNRYVRTVCLPRQNERLFPGKSCYITGWGKTRHPGGAANILQEAELPVISRCKCQTKLSADNVTSTHFPELKISQNMICAGEKDSIKSGCHGDSGGPYVCRGRRGRWVLQGVVSWGSERCDAFHLYSVFARVAKFRNWIDKQMKKY